MTDPPPSRGVVRQVRPDDRPALFFFFDRAYPGRAQFKYPDRWVWMYVDNPAIPTGFGIPAWIALLDGRIVGHTGAMLCKARLGDQERLVAWSIDTIVLPEARGTGLGKRLQAANQAAHDCFMSLSMSPTNRAIKRKLGARTGPSVRLFYRAFDIAPDLLLQGPAARLGRAGAWGVRLALASGLAAGACAILRARLITAAGDPAKSGSAVRMEETTGPFDDAQAAFVTRCTEERDFLVLRSAEYLTWRYRRQPHVHHRTFAVLQGNELVGLAIVRTGTPPEPHLALIQEILVSPGAESAGGVDMAVIAGLVAEKLAREGSIGIYVASATQRKLPGFLDLADETILYHNRDLSKTDETAKLRHFGMPYVSLGDHDWDQRPNARQPSFSEFRRMLRVGKGGIRDTTGSTDDDREVTR